MLGGLQCISARGKAAYATVGQVDPDGVLWKATGTPGKFLTRVENGMDSCYNTLSIAAKRYAMHECVGSRKVLTRTMVDGFEKVTLGPYEYLTYQQYFERVEAVGSGLSSILDPGDVALIYADTALEWMLAAYGCWRSGCTVATCYATLGEELSLIHI